MNSIETNDLTKEDLKKIENHARVYGSLKNTAALEVLMALYTGMRFSEINNLTWSNVDLTKDRIRIIDKVSVRVVSINSRMSTKLKDLKNEQYGNYIEHRYAPEIDYVFINQKMHRPVQRSLEKFISQAFDTKQHVLFRTLRDSVLKIKEESNNG